MVLHSHLLLVSSCRWVNLNQDDTGYLKYNAFIRQLEKNLWFSKIQRAAHQKKHINPVNKQTAEQLNPWTVKLEVFKAVRKKKVVLYIWNRLPLTSSDTSLGKKGFPVVGCYSVCPVITDCLEKCRSVSTPSGQVLPSTSRAIGSCYHQLLKPGKGVPWRSHSCTTAQLATRAPRVNLIC